MPVFGHVESLEISLGLLLDASLLPVLGKEHVVVEGFVFAVNGFVPE